MTRRGWWLVAPELPAARARRRRSPATGGSAGSASARRSRCGCSSSSACCARCCGRRGASPHRRVRPNWLLCAVRCSIQGVLLAYAVLWVVLTIDTLRLVRLVKTGHGRALRHRRPRRRSCSVVASGGAVYAAQRRRRRRATRWARSSVRAVRRCRRRDGYYNILLLGADSGEGRDSMRFDSISVVSVNAETGATTITGIPRDMPNFPFSAGPMQDRYPNGHEGHADPTLRLGERHQPAPHRGRGLPGRQRAVSGCRRATAPSPASRRPRMPRRASSASRSRTTSSSTCTASRRSSTRSAASTSPSRSACPKGGGPAYEGQPAEEWAIGWIEAGPQHMDGDTAQWYARSRYTTDDFDRMKRQRMLQEAILAQFTPQTRADAIPGCRGRRRGPRRRPTCRSRCSRSSPTSRSRRRSSRSRRSS